MAWIEIFKAGRHTSSNGVTADYGVDFIQAVADNYNANIGTHIAPLTLGHNPQSGDPAQAWFKQLRVNGDVLEGELQDVSPDFSTARYKKVSSSFFLPGSPSNPTPGYPNLRHVAALGAETAGCAGLKNISFSADMTGVVEFSDGLDTQIGLFRSLREWIVSKFSVEDADRAVPAGAVEWLNTVNTMDQVDEAVESATGTDAADTADNSTVAPAFSAATEGADVVDNQAEGVVVEAVVAEAKPADFTADQSAQGTADFSAREAALAAKEAEFAAREATLQDAECANFCEGLVAAGQLRACDKLNAKNILASLYKAQGSVDFSEATVPVADAFKQFLKGLPKVVEFGEFAPEETEPHNPAASFVAAPGYEVDAGQLGEYSRLVRVAQERGISLAEAVAQKL